LTEDTYPEGNVKVNCGVLSSICILIAAGFVMFDASYKTNKLVFSLSDQLGALIGAIAYALIVIPYLLKKRHTKLTRVAYWTITALLLMLAIRILSQSPAFDSFYNNTIGAFRIR